MRKGICSGWFRREEWEREIGPALRRAGMRGWTIARDYRAIQAVINSAQAALSAKKGGNVA